MDVERLPDLSWAPVLFADKQLCYCRRHYVSIEHANHAIRGTPCCSQSCYRTALLQVVKPDEVEHYQFHQAA
jgi:hypothetical protein